MDQSNASSLTKDVQVRLFILNFLYAAIIVAAVCLRLGQLYSPTVMPDELGYWSAGAFFSGHLWTDVMPLSPYYSYGYGLILAPLFFLQSPVVMFLSLIHI